MTKTFINIKKSWLNLSFNQKAIVLLTCFLVLIGFSQLVLSAYYGNRTSKGDIKIFIDKYKGDSWNAKDQKREYINRASVRVTNSGTGPIVLTSVGCTLPSMAMVTVFGTSEQKLGQAESILYEIKDVGDKVQFCEVRDSLGNSYQEWDTSFRNKLCWRWNERVGFFRLSLHVALPFCSSQI